MFYRVKSPVNTVAKIQILIVQVITQITAFVLFGFRD